MSAVRRLRTSPRPTAEVTMKRSMLPGAARYAVATSEAGTCVEPARALMIGVATVKVRRAWGTPGCSRAGGRGCEEMGRQRGRPRGPAATEDELDQLLDDHDRGSEPGADAPLVEGEVGRVEEAVEEGEPRGGHDGQQGEPVAAQLQPARDGGAVEERVLLVAA